MCITNGLGDAPKGKFCDFPFSFKGVERNACVGASSGAYGPEGWCLTSNGWKGGCDCVGSTTSPTAGGTGAPSQMPTTNKPSSLSPTTFPTFRCVANGRGQAAAGTPCAFPFQWKGESHNRCVGSGYGGQGFCFTASGKRAGCKCDCDENDDGECIDPDLVTDAPSTPKPTNPGETPVPTGQPATGDEFAPVFVLGPVVVNSTTSSITVEFGLDVAAMVYTYAVVAGSDAPTGTEIYTSRNREDVDAITDATHVSVPNEPFIAVLDGVEAGMFYDIYFFARTRSGVSFTDEDVWGNALYGKRTLTMRPTSSPATFENGFDYN